MMQYKDSDDDDDDQWPRVSVTNLVNIKSITLFVFSILSTHFTKFVSNS